MAKIPKQVREIVYKRDNYTCQKCGSTTNLSIHHIKSSFSGGESVPKNLVLWCVSCHTAYHKPKGDGKDGKRMRKLRKSFREEMSSMRDSDVGI